MVKEEKDISKCSKCGRLEVRRFVGYFPGSGKNKKYVDGEDLIWNGRKCPTCQKSTSKVNIKQKRADAKAGNNSPN